MTEFSSTNQPLRTKERPGRLTVVQVLEIRQKYAGGKGMTQAALAREYNTSRFNIYKVVTYQSYNKVALVTNDAPILKASDEAVAASALKVAAEIALMQQNVARTNVVIDTDKLIEEAKAEEPPKPRTPYY